MTGVGCLLALAPAGIGTLLGAWLIHQPGAQPVLLGRSGYFGATVPELLLSEEPLTATRCDAAVAEEVAAALGGAGGQLAAVMHAGGVLQDGILLKQSAASVRAVLAPKLRFMQHAASAARLQPVRAVNLFSSVSAFLGSPGQANYAAANSALNAWAELLQQHGVAGKWRICLGLHATAAWLPLVSLTRCWGRSTLLCLAADAVSYTFHLPMVLCRQQHPVGRLVQRRHGARQCRCAGTRGEVRPGGGGAAPRPGSPAGSAERQRLCSAGAGEHWRQGLKWCTIWVLPIVLLCCVQVRLFTPVHVC